MFNQNENKMKTNSLTIIVLTAGLIIYSGSLFNQKAIKIENFTENLPKITLEKIF